MEPGGIASEVLDLATDLASFGIDPRVILNADLDTLELSFYGALRKKLLEDRDIRERNLAIDIGNNIARAMGGS